MPVVGALGRLTAQKGFDVLLEAVRLLVGRAVSLQVVLGGEGRERAALERQAAGLPVTFTGFAEDPRAVLALGDVFVLPSRVEALPLVLVEAVSAGLPAVATDVGDVREALGDVAVVVPPQDPVALADGLRHHGHRVVKPVDNAADLAGNLRDVAADGDIIVCMGAGDITKWAAGLADGIAKSRAKKK